MKLFTKNKENFICKNCGKSVVGNGYTNHCPNCLYSKHVDINPGDRLAKDTCGGLMKPIRIEKRGANFSIVQKCQKCGHERKNKTQKEDNFEEIIKISKNPKNL